MLNVAFTGGAAVGPGLAGLVVAGFGVQSALLLDAASFYAIGWILLTAGPLPHVEPDPGRLRERVRAGLAYIREQADAAAAAGRPGRGLRLLRRGDPDRGDLRQADPRRQRLRLRPAARKLGGRHGAGQHRLRRRAPGARCPICSSSARSRSAPATSASPRRRPWRSPARRRCVGGAGNGVQWVAVVSAVQELTVPGHAGAGDERARVDRRGHARRRIRDRRR